ncbi:MAG: glycosyltransferase family 2 protein [Bacteroidales bacterium]|nr:glycosyltransferase family 2 protein [Bacteroidales bacterium]
MIKISVILTTYNSALTLQNTLDSIFGQTDLNKDFTFELLVADDCSTDKTQQILRNNQVDFICTEKHSGGPNKGRNLALKKVTGEYICFIDHDDVWEPDKTRCQLLFAKNYPIVSTGYQIIDHSFNRIINRFSDEYPRFYASNETFLHCLARDKKGQNFYFSTLMIHADLKRHEFEESFGCVDFDWILRIFENNPSVEIPQMMMSRHVYSSNLSLNDEFSGKDFYYSLLTLENYEEKYPEETKKGIKNLYGSRARYFFLKNKMKHSRKYFLYSPFQIKNMAYLASSFICSNFIRKTFHFYG